MTSELHERATERTAEALDILKNEYGYEFDIVAMVQGDEPMFDPMDVSHAIAELNNRSEVNIVNLMRIMLRSWWIITLMHYISLGSLFHLIGARVLITKC